MDLGEFLEGIEKLIVKILLWVVIIPKTLFRILTEPTWIVEYIDDEIAAGKEDKDNQFDEYMSPILLFLICSLVLFIILGNMPKVDAGSNDIFTLFRVTSEAGAGEEARTNSVDSVLQTVQGVNGLLAALTFLSLPLLFALAIEFFGKREIKRATLNRTLNIQCYFFSPLTLSIFSAFIISSLLNDSFDGVWIIFAALFVVVATIAWFIIVQVQFIKQEIGGALF